MSHHTRLREKNGDLHLLVRFSPWAKWLKMADRYHLGGRRPPYIKLKLIVCRFQKYMMEML